MQLKFGLDFTLPFLLIPTTSGQDVPASVQPVHRISERGVAIVGGTNPFLEGASLQARVAYIDRNSPSLGWFTTHGVAKKDDGYETFSKRESILRILALSKSESDLLDSVFQERISQHNENRHALKVPLLRERDLRLLDNGVKPLSDYASSLEINKDALSVILQDYKKNELVAEKILVEKLGEILVPQKLKVLVEQWWSIDLLYVPLVAHYLDLTEEQVNKIELATNDAYKLEQQLLRGVASIEERKKILSSSSQRYESVYDRFSHFTPRQFRIAATGLLSTWKRSPSFSQRLDELSNPSDMRAVAELKILGDLYRNGVESEKLR